jgi:hypothetical protein
MDRYKMGIEDKITLALEEAQRLEWITVNKHLADGVLAGLIRDFIAQASFRDVMEFFNRP